MLLKNVKGLGLKTAQKIIVELSGKMAVMGQSVSAAPSASAASGIYDEAMAALTMRGFQRAASDKVLKAILKESPSIAVEEAVRQALRRM